MKLDINNDSNRPMPQSDLYADLDRIENRGERQRQERMDNGINIPNTLSMLSRLFRKKR